MNKIFRVIWSHAQQAWVVVSELVKSHGKSAISIDKRISPNFSAVLLEQQNGFSLSPVTKAILVGLLGLSFADFAYSRAVLGGGSATDSNDYSNTVVGDSAVALSVNDRPHQEGDYGTDSVVIGYHAKTKKGGHLTNPGLGNASRAVVIGGRAQGVEGAVAIGWKTDVSKLYGVAVGRDATVGGEYAVAIGSNEDTQKTQALGTASIAIGRQAKAEGYASLALSMSAQALGTSSVAMMYDAKATGVAAVAVGRETRAGNHSTALGGGANATGNRSIAIGAHKDANSTWSGSGAEATGEDSIALGTDATASAIDSIAIGKESKAEGDRDSVAIGKSSNAKAYGTALGSSTVAHTDALAAGNSADATKNDSTALGAHTQATGRAAVAIGSSAIADSNGDVTRSIASARNTIAIGGGKASQIEAISIGAKSQATQTQSIAIGSESSASAAQAVTIGSNTVASGYGAISIGGDDLNTTEYHNVPDITTYFGTTASGKASVAIGGKSNAIGDGSVVVGPASRATNKEGVVIGAKSSSTADYGIAVGSSATAGSYAVAVGKSATASQTGTSAFGEFAEATAQRATALGNHSKADVENGVALGYMSKTTRNTTNNEGWKQDTSAYSALNNNVRTATHAAVAVGNDTTGSIVTRQITGVAAGSQDTDAVNLAQLKALTLNIKGQDNTTGDVTLSTETLELVGENGIATTVDQANGKTKIKIIGSNVTRTTTYKADGGMSNNKLSNDTIGYVADSPSNTVSILTTYDWEDLNGGNAQKYKGENIQSIRKENGDFYLGIKESPTFKTVTASESVTVTGGPTISTNGIDMGNKQITNLAEGTQNNHAVTKGQLDATVGRVTYKADLTSGAADNSGKSQQSKDNYDISFLTNGEWTSNSNARFVGDNIETSRTDNTIYIGIKEHPMFKSVQYGNNGPKITYDGDNLKVTKANGSDPVKITNVADGTANNDAVNKKQLDDATVTYFHTNTGDRTQGEGDQATNKGKITDKAGARGNYSVTAGVNTKAEGANSIAIGYAAKTTNQNAVTVGASSQAGDHSVAYGYEAKAIGTGSVAVGEKAVTNENINRATALGNNSIVTVGGGVALGYGSKADTAGNIEGERQAHSVVTGEKSETNGFKSTRNVNGNDIGAVSVGGTTIKRQITNVAAGKELTDAVNVAQLKSLTMKIGGDQNTGTPAVGIWDGKLEVKGTSGEIKTSASGSTITVSLDDAIKTQLNNARAGSLTFKGEKIGNGTQSDTAGHKWTANEDKTVTIASNERYTVDSTSYHGDNIEIYRKNDNNGEIFHVLMKDAPTFSSVQYGDNGPKITSAGGNLKVTGADGSSPVKITNVANGEQDNDAVNFSQLNPLITKITNLESKQIKYFSVNSTGGGNVNNDGATKSNAIAIGRDATASQNQAVALGKGATSNGLGAVAIGGQFDTEEEERTYSMNQDGSREVHSNAGLWAKVQYNAEKKEGEVGKTRTTQATSASGMYSVAIGSKTRAEGNGALALGYAAYAKGGGVALGLGAAVGESDGISIGTFSATKAVASIALGYFAKAENKHSLAFGRDSKAAKDGGVALGFKSEATIEGGKAGTKQDYSAYTGTQGAFTSTATVGNDSVGAVSVGKADGTITRQIVGVAAGTNDTDAANVAQLKSLTMKIGGNTNETTQPKVGLWESTLNVKGDNGLTSHASGDTITVKLTDEIKQKIDGLETKVNNQGITFKGNTGQTGSIKLGDTLKVEGVTDETVVTASTDKLALGLAQKVKDEIAGKMSSFKIKANDTGEQEITNGNTIVFKNGKNINVTRNDKELTFATTETPEFTSVQYGNDGPKITKDNDGNLKVTKADGNAPVKITNVAEGTETNDAVNLSQLTSATQTYFHTNTGLNTQGVGNENTNLGSLEEKAGATGKYAVTAGVNTKATSNQAVAIGKDTKATASSAIAIGSGKPENPNGLNLLKARYNPTTKEVDAGHRFDPTDTETVASGSMSLAIGGLSKATGHVSVALGAYSYALDHEAIAIGSRTAASGAAAVAIGSLSAASGGDAVAIGWGAKARGDFSAALGLNAKALNKNAIAIGNGATAGIEKDTTNISTVAIGESAVASHKETIAIGKGAKATAEKAISIGTGNTVSGAKSGAIGDPNTVSGAASYVMGNDNTVTHTKAFVLGNNVTTGADDSVYLGDSSAVNTGDSSGGVTSAVASGEINGITYGNFAATTPVGVVTVGAATKERRIQNVAAGKISATSTDAINGSQLYLTNNVIGNIAKTIKPILGGDADYKTSGDEAGKFTMTNIGATGKNNIHDAIIAAKSVVKAGKNISSVDTKNETDGSKTYTVNAYKTTVAAKEGDNIINIEGGNAGDDNVLAYKIGVNKDEIKKLVTAAPSNIKYKANSTGEQTVSLTEGLDFTNGTHTKATVGANGVVTFDLNESAVNKLNMVETVKSGNEDKITVTSNNNNTSGGKEFVVNLTEKVTSDIAKGVEAKNTVDTQGITFKGDNNGAGVTKKLGETLMIEGGDNITTKAENDKVTVNLDNNVNLTANGSVKFGDDKNAQLNKDGLIVKTDDNPTASIEVTKTGIKAGDKKITNVANGDVSASSTDAVTGQQLHNLVKVNGQAAESGGSVNFVDGNGTTVSSTNGEIKVNVSPDAFSTTITHSNGKVVVPDDETKLVTAKSVAEAVNNVYWKATSGVDGGTQAEGNTPQTANVKAGDQVTFKAGKNLSIKQTDKDFTYALQDNISLTKVTTGNTEMKNDSITITPVAPADGGPAKSPVKLTASGLDNGGNKIINVANGNVASGSTDAVTGDQLHSLTEKVNKGWKVAISGNTTHQTVPSAHKVEPDSTVTFDGGSNIKLTQENGKITVATTDTPSFNSVTLTQAPSEDNHAVTKSYVDTQVGGKGQNFIVGAGNDKTPTITVNSETDKKRFDVVGHNHIETAVEDRTVKVGLSSDAKNKIDKIDTIETQANKKLSFAGDSGTAVEKALGETVNIAGSSNIETKAENNGVTVSLKTDVNLTDIGSVKFGDDDKNAKLTKEGLTLKTADSKDIQITKEGIKAGDQKITNVANGSVADNSKDAVTGHQLHNLIKVNGNVATGDTSDSVNFANSTTANVTATGGTIKVDVNTGALSTSLTLAKDENVNNGKVATPVEGDKNKFVTAESVANAINETFWKVTSDVDGGTRASNTQKTIENIKAGDLVTLKAGDNLVVKQSNKDFTFSLNNKLNLGSEGEVKFASTANGSAVLNKDGLTVGSGNNIVKVTKEGIDAGNKVISNVATPVNDNDATNKKYVDDGRTTVTSSDNSISVTENAQTTGVKDYDIKVDYSKISSNINLKYTANDTDKKEVKLSDGLIFKNTDNITASVEDSGVVKHTLNSELKGINSIASKTTDGTAEATKIELSKDANDKKVTLNEAKVTGLKDGDVSANSKDAVTGKQLHNFIKVGDSAVAKDGVVKFANGSGTTINTTTEGTIKVDVNTTALTMEETGAEGQKTKTGKVATPSEDDKSKLVTAETVANAINKSGFKLISGADGGTNSTEDSLKTNGEMINPGDTLKVIAGKNINLTHSTSGNIKVATVDTPMFTSVQFGDNGPKISKSDSGDLKLGKGTNGSEAVKITNVADGDVKDNSADAVTGKQLHNYLKVDGASAHKDGSINFADGTTTSVNADNGVVKIEVNTTALSTTLTTNNGSVTNPTNTEGTKFATASSVASAINDVYWSATSGTATGGTQDGTAQTANVKAGNTVTFKAGKNLTIKQDGTENRDFTYSLNSALKDITSIANGTEGTGTKITLSSNSKEMNVGGAKISNVAAPTESTDAATKKYVDDSRTTVTSGSDVLTITDANANDQSKTNKAYTITLNADKLNSAANLSYKANNKDGKTTPLSTGLDFTNTTNITASIADNGVVKHTLNSELKSITSIASKEDGTGTKVTLSAADNDKKVTLNDAKLTGLTDGKLAADSKDAVTGKQLKDLADKIGVGLETNSTTAFKTPTFTKLKASAADTTEPKEAKTVVEALEATRSKVNEGLKFKGEETDDAKTITKQLGETLQFVSGNIDQTADGATTHYKGENLAVISDGSKIVVGLKEKPEFKEVTVKDGNNTTTVGATSIKVGDTTADDDKPVTITAGENNEGGSISNLKTTLTTPDAVTSVSKPNSFTTTNAATLGDVLNAGWNLEANGSAVDFVQPYDKVNFTGEKGVAVTSVVKDGKATIKVSSETEALEIVEGKAKLDTVKQLEDAKKALQEAQDAGLDTTQLAEKVNKLEVAKDKVEEKLVTAKEVADAINESGWKTTSDVEGSGKRAESTTQTTEYIKAGELVTFKAGDNLIIKQDGKNFTYSLNPALTGLTSAEFKGADGEAKTNITKEGITITPATPTAAGKSEVKLTASGLNNGGNKITNVAEGTDDNDAVNVSQLNTKTAASKTEVESKDKSIGVSSIAGSSGQKIYDLSVNNAVITSSADFKTVEASKNGNAFATAENVAHAINTATAAATTEVTSTDGSVNILETRGDNGQNIYDLEVVRSALSISDDGKEVTSATTGDAFATGDDVANVVNKAAASARTEIKDGKNTKASIDQTGVDGQDIYKIDVEGELTGITSIANGNNDAKDNGTKISLSEDPNNKVVTLNDAKLTGLVDGNVTSTSKEAITGNQLKDLADKVGVELAADSTTLFKKPEFTKLKANKDTDVTAKEAKTVVEALEETRTTVNKGLIFVGEDNLNPLTKQLGETLTITSGDITKDGVEYKGSNLRVEADGTNIEIGLKENPEFKAITVKDGDQTTTVTNNTVTIGAKDQNAKPITISATDNANTISGLTTAIADPDTADTKAKSKDKPNNLTTTNAATLGDVLNTGWNLKANDDALDFVRPYDSVKFQDGAGTFVTTATDGKESIIQIDIDNGTLTTTTDGKVVGMVTAEKSKELTDNIIDAETELRDAKDALTELGDNATEEAKNTAIQAIKDAEAKVQKAYDDADKAGLNKVATAQNVAEAINNSGWRVTAGKTTGVVKGEKETLVKPSDLVTFKAGDNIVIEQDGSNFTFALSDTVKTNAITVGEKGADGKDGVDGTIGVNGKDGSAVVINGKDGSIGLNGKDGVNGVTIKGDQGPAGVDGKDGETKTRIVYEYTDPKSPNTPIKEEIATLKDGQKYSGDNYVADNADTVIKKKLNERLEIKGGVTDETKLSDNNIGVIAENGVLNVRLAKNINLGNDGSVTTGNTKVDNNGITIKKPADAGDGKSDVKLTASGLDNGGNTIINVAAGVADTDAVNVKQLKDTVNAAATDVVSNDGSIDVMGEVDAVTGKNTYDLSVKTSGLTSSPDKKTVNADVTGKAFATAETVANAINTATAAATSEVISTNGSVSINEMTGDKGQNIYDLEVTRSELSISDDGKTVTSGTAGEAFVTGDDVANVVNKAAASARTEIKDGKNTKASIDQTGLDGHDIYKIDVEGDLTGITSIANGNNDAKDNGTKISLSNDPDNKTVDVHGAKITNVAAGKADTDAVNVSQLTAAAKGAKTEVESSDASVEVTENRGDNGQTVYDLAVVKSKLNAAEDKRTVAAETKGNAFVTGEEVAKAINTTTAAARTEVTDGRNTQVVATTGENGQDIYNVSVSGLPMEYATEDGKSIINMGGNFYLEEPAADGSIKLIPVVNAKGKFSAKTQNPDGSVTLKPLAVKVNLANEAPMVLGNVAEGVADTDAVNVKQLKSAKTEVESTDHSVVIKERQGDNQQIVYDLTVAKTKLTASEDKRTISAEDKGNHFATGDEVAAAINTATAAARTEVEAGKNVKVTSKTGANGQNIYNVSVSGDLSDITSISNGDTKVSLGKDKQGNPVVNMNGARITNIGDGSAEGDVVNVRQLNKVVSSVNAGFNQLSKDIGRVDVNARAGIASAGAMANLSQVYLPGKSAISVSGAQYRGQAAYAIGYSRISDNGKWLIRASVSSNTQRDTMIGGGASFVW
ncbi:ESPR-type extended signal peptide-containing protein [Glaesserella parasuis]|uniref:ESPR-type extended signal peptide-containing protein n=1 Tax=Glaesserella parasuis TaxID=738 RepID=UPI003B680037